MQKFTKDRLSVRIYEEETEMGVAAADFVADHLRTALKKKGNANLILATGASQFKFIKAFQEKRLQWDKITVFHLDEYLGISEKHPASFRKYLKERILNNVQPGRVYLIEGDSESIEEEIKSYQALLKKNPIDVACIGIGENGHIAFNDPPVADFNDSRLMKVVELEEDCRRQQVNEGWFSSLDKVPKKAISLTIPTIMDAEVISCVVPGKRKAKAVDQTLNGEISTDCPATILRTHPNCVLFLDRFSGADLL